MQKRHSLPDLPAIKKKREAGVTPKVLEWFRENHHGSCAIEIKATKENTIAPSVLKPHQENALKSAERAQGLVYKISDESRGRKPFDAFKLASVQAYVVACFTSHGVCHVVPVAEWKGTRYDATAYPSIRL